MAAPKISVITPVFNTGKTIETALQSVAGQTYPSVEHIIIDGSSGDDTLMVVRKYQESHRNIRLLSEPDTGVYNAMNKGMDLSTGDWLFFLGADDEFYDNNVLNTLFEKGLLQEEHIVYGNVLIEGDSFWAKDKSIYDGPFDLEKLFKRNLCHQSIFYPRSVIKKVGYFQEKYSITSDWDYNIHCFAHYRFTYTDQVIAIFRSGGKSSHGGDHLFYDELPENVVRYFNLNPKDEIYYDFNSPFYYPVSRFREITNQKTIDQIHEEKGKIHATLVEQQKQYEDTIAKLTDEHSRSVEQLNHEHEQKIILMELDHKTSLSVQQKEFDSVIHSLKQEHGSAISFLGKGYDEALAALKRENTLKIESVEKDYQLKMAENQAEFLSKLNILQKKYDDDLSRSASEYSSLKDQSERISRELNERISACLVQIEHQARTISQKEQQIDHLIENHSRELTDLTNLLNARENQIEAMHHSPTWKVGRFFLEPLKPLKKFLRRNQ